MLKYIFKGSKEKGFIRIFVGLALASLFSFYLKDTWQKKNSDIGDRIHANAELEIDAKLENENIELEISTGVCWVCYFSFKVCYRYFVFHIIFLKFLDSI